VVQCGAIGRHEFAFRLFRGMWEVRQYRGYVILAGLAVDASDGVVCG
jgi:hypothetical protein